MAKWCFIMSPANMNTSKRMASVLTEVNMFTIGMIANIVTMTKRKNAASDDRRCRIAVSGL